ncbi:MAG TPA: CHAD domain-containing protein [Gaiellaceae bacterium]|nr:CHAD domain-containing protein [Gaiellaceae bacterium]
MGGDAQLRPVEDGRADAIRRRAFELSLGGEGTPLEHWLQAEQEFAVVHEYDTPDRDFERVGITLARLPAEAGAVWRLTLPRGERVEAWEPGTDGLAPPEEITRLLDRVAAGKRLVPSPPASDEPGARRLRAMLEAQRDALLAHDPGTRLGADPENLHQHRVAARRSRAFLRASSRYLDPVWTATIADLLRRLGSATGPVRDLDVMLEHVRSEAASLDPVDAPGAARLLEALDEKHRAARAELLAALDSAWYRTLPGRLRVPRLADGVEAVPLRRIARKELRRLLAAVARLGADAPEAEIHRLRITLKRARYAAELAMPGGASVRRFLERAKALQDALGEHQDAVVAEERLRSTAVHDAATAAAFVAGRLAERQRLRRERVRAELPEAWKRLRKSARKLD